MPCGRRFSYDKVPRDFDSAAWSTDHDTLLRRRQAELEADGWAVTVENQNNGQEATARSDIWSLGPRRSGDRAQFR